VEGSTDPVASVLLFRAYCGMASCKSTRELLQNKKWLELKAGDECHELVR